METEAVIPCLALIRETERLKNLLRPGSAGQARGTRHA